MGTEAPTPLDQTFRIKMCRNIAGSTPFRRIAKRSIVHLLPAKFWLLARLSGELYSLPYTQWFTGALSLKIKLTLLKNKGCAFLNNHLGCVWLVIPNLPHSENGKLRRDGNTLPNQTKSSSKQQVSTLSWRRRGFRLKNTKTSLVRGNKE